MNLLPIERVFKAPALDGPSVRPVGVSPDGARVAFLRSSDEDPTCQNLWVIDADGAAPARQLVAVADGGSAALDAEQEARLERQRIHAHGVFSAQWGPCGAFLYAATPHGTQKVAVASASTRRVLPPGATDVRSSPDGKRLAFVEAGALWTCDADGEQPQRFSPEAADELRFGVAEFVAQEEFARDTGFWWRPDGGAIAFTRVDETGVGDVSRIETSADGSRLVRQRFPKAGSANARVDLFVRVVGAAEAVNVDLGRDSDVYLLRVDWSADGRTLYIQRQSRDQRRLDLLAADPATGRTRLLLTEERDPWVTANPDFRPLRDGGFLWVSERTGFNQLYRYAAEGDLVAQLTDAPEPLASRDRERGLVGVDEAAGLAFVLRGVDGALERHLFAVPLDGAGEARRLTAEPGWWDVVMSPDGRSFVGTHSSPRQPPRTGLYRSDGGRIAWIEPNRMDERHPYHPYREGLPEPTFGRLEAEDGQALDYVLLRPSSFDAARRYPAIVQVYGGPGRQHVRRAWRSPAERVFLDAGYVLFQLDNRGACGRGLAFEAPIHKRLGTPELADQLRGIAHLRALPFVDPDRIGAMGWSYGGFMTLRLLTEPGSGVRAGIAGGSIARWEEYDTHYTEHYLGQPSDEPGAFRAASVLPRLKDLHGRLLLVHGLADDNVLADHAFAIAAELQRLGTTFDMMLYPGQRHAIVGAAAELHRHRTYLEFLDRELAA